MEASFITISLSPNVSLNTDSPKYIFLAALLDSLSSGSAQLDKFTLFLFPILEGLPGNFDLPIFISTIPVSAKERSAAILLLTDVRPLQPDMRRSFPPQKFLFLLNAREYLLDFLYFK